MPLGELELGLHHHDALIQVKKLIWNRVHRTTEAPEPFDALAEDDLKSTLEIRYRRGESYYVLIPPRDTGALAGNTTLLHLLRQDLPYLGAFLIGVNTGEQVLVMNEARLMVLIREFLLMLRNYQ